jgi:hypothetical protein
MTQPYGQPWYLMFDDARREIAQKAKHRSTLQLLFELPAILSWTEFRPLNQRTVAARLKISPASISYAMKELHDLGMVERQGNGPVLTWRLALKLGWRGTPAAYLAEQRRREQQPRQL